MKRNHYIGLAAIVVAAFLSSCRRASPDVAPNNDDVLRIAYQFKDGGGYAWKGSGSPIEIRYQTVRILSKSRKTDCVGYTFAVAWLVGKHRGLLKDKTIDQIWRFQKEWFCATSDSREQGPIVAVEHLGIGHRVTPVDAIPGDFIQLWNEESGHQAVFLGWVRGESNHIIGVKYRGSQGVSDGISDSIEYFQGSGKIGGGQVNPSRFYIARLNPAPGSR